MTLYEPGREAVERIKAAMEQAVASAIAGVFHPDAALRHAVACELRHAIKMDLRDYREAVWRSARLVAAYEFSVDHTALTTFWKLWEAAERNGKFKADRFLTDLAVRQKS